MCVPKNAINSKTVTKRFRCNLLTLHLPLLLSNIYILYREEDICISLFVLKNRKKDKDKVAKKSLKSFTLNVAVGMSHRPRLVGVSFLDSFAMHIKYIVPG